MRLIFSQAPFTRRAFNKAQGVNANITFAQCVVLEAAISQLNQKFASLELAARQLLARNHSSHLAMSGKKE